MNHFETQVNQAIDTIAAVATPHGRGGIAVIRISGPSVQTIGKDLLGHLPKTRYAEYLSFLAADRTTIDEGLAIYFQAPNSFTGEDVSELQGHGGPVIANC